jgi:hypothetical protein
MGSILEDLEIGAKWIVDALNESGYAVDLSPASLWQVEFFFEDHVVSGRPVRGGLLAKDMGGRIFSLGAYVGEVIRRARGGEWVGDESDPAAEINVELHLPDGTVCWPIQRVMKRFKQGPEDSISAYGLCLGLNIGPRPEHQSWVPKRPWWKFW